MRPAISRRVREGVAVELETVPVNLLEVFFFVDANERLTSTAQIVVGVEESARTTWAMQRRASEMVEVRSVGCCAK